MGKRKTRKVAVKVWCLTNSTTLGGLAKRLHTTQGTLSNVLAGVRKSDALLDAIRDETGIDVRRYPTEAS